MSGVLVMVEVAYALPERQTIVELQLPAGSCAREAVVRSGLAQRFPEIDATACPLGIFGREVADDHVLGDGDRVEIYRPLLNEPRTARRERAAEGRTMGQVGSVRTSR